MTQPPPRPAEPRAPDARAEGLTAFVSAALDLRDAGRADWLDEACKPRPELREQVRALVERAHALPAMLGKSGGLDPLLGRQLGGRFRVIERIGAGSMGVVYLAEDRELGRKVACKVVRHGLMAPERALERFAREARSMAAVQHPAVAAIHDRGRTEDDQVYLVMEFVDGTPLSELLEAAEQRKRSPERSSSDSNAWIEERFGIARRGEASWLRSVVRWTAELAHGLEAVHRAGVLHRDIKPSNIRVRRDGRPALLDFGIALLDDGGSITRTPSTLGTPAYMPPETMEREGRRTGASDTYSLAATLYHLLTLHAPYEGTPTQVLAAVASREPLPASRWRPGLPRDLQAILDKGMHRRPSARYASAAALEADLRAFLEFQPISARPVSRLERVGRRILRSRAALGALVALLLASLLAVSFAGVRAWRARVGDARPAQLAELSPHVPPNFSVVGASNRVIHDEADKRALAALLDEAADTAIEPLPARLLRASFRQDHGDAAGAAQDMAAVAQFVGTPFARELAARYAPDANEPAGVPSVELAGLPEPQSPTDRYLLAYHWLRREKPAQALPLLADAEVRRIPHAEELFLASTNFDRLSLGERRRLAVERYADLVRLESRMHARTATTAHIAGRMLALQGRFDEALRACTEGLELAPSSHVLRINAGYSAFAEHQLADARRHLEIARALRPSYARIVQDLVWVEIADRRFDVAERLVRESEPRLEPRNATWGDSWSGVVATYAALDARAGGDRAACTAQLDRALELFARVRDAGGKPTATAERITTALASEDEQALVLALAQLLEEEPDNWWRRELLAVHLPSTLGPEATDAVRRVFEASSTNTSPQRDR